MARAHFKSVILQGFQCNSGCAVGDQSWWCALIGLFSYLLSVWTCVRLRHTHTHTLHICICMGRSTCPAVVLSFPYKYTNRPCECIAADWYWGALLVALQQRQHVRRFPAPDLTLTLSIRPWEEKGGASAWWGEAKGKGGMYTGLLQLVSCLHDFSLQVCLVKIIKPRNYSPSLSH